MNLVNIYKSGISALQFTVEQGKLTSGAAKLSLSANTDSDLELLAKNSSIRVTNDAVHIAPKLITDAVQVSTLDAAEVTTTNLTTDELATDTLEANTIVANNSILYHPLLDDGRILDTSTIISVHGSMFALSSAIKELKDATDVEYNTVKATTTLLSPGTLDGQRTGVIQNIASISAESVSTTTATVTDLTAVNISGVDGFEAAQVSADAGVFGNINVANTVAAGTVNASTAVSTATVTSTTATIPTLTTTTLRPVDNSAGVVISGSDGYSYLTLNGTGAMVTDTKSVKMVTRTLDGKTAGITMTGDGVTIQENTIIIPNAVSVIHSLMQDTITSESNYNELREEVDQLSEDFTSSIEEVTSEVVALQSEVDSLTLTAQSDIAALQSDVSSLTLTTQSDIVALQSDVEGVQLDVDRLQEEIDNIDVGGTGTLTPGEPISTTLVYGSTSAPEDVYTPGTLVLSASPIFMSNKSGRTYSDVTELRYDSIVVSTDLSYITINGQSDYLITTLCYYTPLSSPNAFPEYWENLVPTFDQISRNMVYGELGALMTRPLIKGAYISGSVSAKFNNVLPCCTLELGSISSQTRIGKSSFSFVTEALYDMCGSRVYDLELRLLFSTAASGCFILTDDIIYASNQIRNGTPMSGLLYAGSLKTYSGTLRVYPDQSWVLFDNYATFY